MNSNNEFDFEFWKIEFRDRFDLDRKGYEILNSYIHNAPLQAKVFIIDTYQREVYREDIIDKYCDKYDSEKINSILKQIEFDELQQHEINVYNISPPEEGESL